jgi:hypothetical protein
MEEADGSSMTVGDGCLGVGGGSCITAGGCMAGVACSAIDDAIISFMMRARIILYRESAISLNIC